MEAIEIKNELARIAEEVKQEGLKAKQDFESALKGKADGSELAEIKQKFMELTDNHQEQIEKYAEIAEKQGLKINELSEKGNSSVHKSFRENLTDAIAKQADVNKEMKDKPGVGRQQIIIPKIAATITTANILPGVSTAIPYSLVGASGEFIGTPRRNPFIREILNARPTNSMYEWWAEMVNPDGGADSVLEGAAKPLVDFDVQERTAKVEKIAAFAKMSKEVLADVVGFRNFVEEELETLVELELDQQLYEGNGTSPNLKGLYAWATTITVPAPFALGVNLANNFDVLLMVKAVMAATYHFNANVALVNPLDLGFMQLMKEPTTGQYIMPPFSANSGVNIAGLQVIANSEVDAGTFVVMDSSKPRLRIREEFTIDYGYENDDFRKNLVSVVGETRALLYLPTNYAGAVLKGTFATVAAAMETA